MDHIQGRSKPSDLRLSYFSASKLLTKARRYTISPNLSGEPKSRYRKMQQSFLDCDCACAGKK